MKADDNFLISSYELKVLRLICLIGAVLTPCIITVFHLSYPDLIIDQFHTAVFSLAFFAVYILSHRNAFVRNHVHFFSYTAFSLASVNCLYFAYVNRFSEGFNLLLILMIFVVILVFRNTVHLLCYQAGMFLMIAMALYSRQPVYVNREVFLIIILIYFVLSFLILKSRLKIQKSLNDQFEAIFENMTEAMFIFDQQGKYVFINKAGRQRAGRGMKQIGESYGFAQYFDLEGNAVPFADTPACHAMHGRRVEERNIMIQFPDGVKYVSMSGSPIFDKKGNFLYGVVTNRDITDRILQEQKIKEQEKILLESEKVKKEALEKAMALKDEFLALISHEFKTPISIILAAIQVLNHICKEELPDKANRYLHIIRQNAYRQMRLVNNLLDVIKINAGQIKLEKKNVDVVLLTKAIIDSVEPYATQKEIAMRFETALSKKIICIDSEKYERILLNLLSNAIKFSEKGKAVIIKISEKNALFSLAVLDEGIGIPTEKQELIFERFGQADPSLSRDAEGTGIGLYLVRLLVEAHGGEISVESCVGKGSTFEILLPSGICENPVNGVGEQKAVEDDLTRKTAIEFSDIYF